jgi:hypothetical protein
MRTYTKLILAAVTATVVLGAAVGFASANRIALRLEPAKLPTFRAVWTEMIFSGSGLAAPVTCPVTIEGSFHSRTISKVLEQLIGYVTRAIVGEASCAGGRARALAETLPWHIRYGGFEGRLPEITTITQRIVGGQFLIQAVVFGFNISCLYTSTAASPMVGRVNMAGSIAESITIREERTIPISPGQPGSCPAAGTLRGRTSSLTLLGVAERIELILVQ